MRTLATLGLAVLFTTLLSAQYFDGGVIIGAANYTGELTNHQLDFAETQSVFGVFGRYNYSEHLAFRGSLSRAQLSGTDANAALVDLRMRNLSFQSEVIELGATVEYNLLKYNIPAQQTSTPYLFAGVAGYYFNPQAQYGGQWHDLQPLRTEGQPPYRRLQVAVPFGLGFKFALGLRANLGFQVGVRKLFTDYLDDVSTVYPDLESLEAANPLAGRLSYRSLEVPVQNPSGRERGNPLNDDSYIFSTINLSVNLTNRYGLDFDERFEIFKPAYNDPELLRLQAEKKARKAALAEAKAARRAQRVKQDAATAQESAAKRAQRLRNEADAAERAHLLDEAQLAERAAKEAARRDAKQRETAEREALAAKRRELSDRRKAAVREQRTAIRAAKTAADQQRQQLRLEDPRYAAKQAKKAAETAERKRQAAIKTKAKEIARKRKLAKQKAREKLRDLKDDKVSKDSGKLRMPTKARKD